MDRVFFDWFFAASSRKYPAFQICDAERQTFDDPFLRMVMLWVFVWLELVHGITTLSDLVWYTHHAPLQSIAAGILYGPDAQHQRVPPFSLTSFG